MTSTLFIWPRRPVDGGSTPDSQFFPSAPYKQLAYGVGRAAACEGSIVVDPADSEDPIFTVEVRTPWGSLDVMAKVTVSGRSLELNGMHVGGNPLTTWGAARLRDIGLREGRRSPGWGLRPGATSVIPDGS